MGRGHLTQAGSTSSSTSAAGLRYTNQVSSPQSASSPSSSPSSSPLPHYAPPSPPPGPTNQHGSTSSGNRQLVATFKLPKTCTACGKAIKTQGKVCAKCKMRKYRERKKEQEQSLKTQMKQYREQEEALKNRILQLEEEVRRSREEGSGSSSRSPAPSIMKSEPMASPHEGLLAQQQEVLKQQQEIISVQQSVIAQQQHIINQHNLGHLASAHLQQQRRFLVDRGGLNAAAAVAVLAALGEPRAPLPASTSSPSHQLRPSGPILHPQNKRPPFAHYGLEAPHQHSSLLQLTRVATQEVSGEREVDPAQQRSGSFSGSTDSAPNSPNANRMAITHLLAPTELCTVSCV